MKDSDKKILLVLLAAAILVLTYMYVYKSAKADIDTLNADIDTLQVKLDDLKAKESLKDQYLAETEEYNVAFDEVLANYPADLNQETTVMFTKGVEEQFDFTYNSLGLGQPSQYYVLGQTTSDDSVVVSDTDESTDESYVCTSAAFTVSYEGSYDDLKAYMDYIANYKYRMTISNINISYSMETERCTGSLTLNAYAISGPDRTADTVDVDVPTGVDNIFVGGSSSAASSAAVTYKYDSDEGAAIVSDYNVMMLLNNANSDSASGIIVAADKSDEDTYVSSNDNSAVDVKISVYSADGKNFVSYEIGDQSYEKELLTDDVTIYVKSSARVDSDDTNAVNVTVSNTTSLPVFFKVADDDTTSPRFKVVNKSGVVKVY
jgi:Tfp pilus assembly protein PilO